MKFILERFRFKKVLFKSCKTFSSFQSFFMYSTGIFTPLRLQCLEIREFTRLETSYSSFIRKILHFQEFLRQWNTFMSWKFQNQIKFQQRTFFSLVILQPIHGNAFILMAPLLTSAAPLFVKLLLDCSPLPGATYQAILNINIRFISGSSLMTFCIPSN